MWTPQYDIIVETLTGSEFEVTVTDKDTIGYIKSRIQKYEGIPVGQQHLLYNQKELNDATEMKDIPLSKGSRLKLVLGMKGGPVSARRVVTLPDYDSWFDLNDILNTSRQDPLTISTSGVKLLVYKDCKKNIHRVMKFRAERKNSNEKISTDNELTNDDQQDDQWLKDNIHTMEKMYQLRTKLSSKGKNKNSKLCKNSQQLQQLQQSSEEKQKRFRIGAIGDRAKKDIKREPEPSTSSSTNKLINNNESDNNGGSGAVSKALRRLYFPPLKAAKAVDSILSNLTNSSTSNRNDVQVYNDHGFRSSSGGGVLNKHGIAKTCIRPPSISSAQQLERKSPTPPPPQSTTSSLPSLTSQPIAHHKSFDFTDYFNVNSKLRIGYTPSTENRTKIRDNIRRNRSFKAINSNNSNDLIIEESNSLNQNRPFSSVIGQLYANKSVKQFHKPTSSASVHDLIEKFSTSKLLSSVGNNNNNESSDSLLSCGTNNNNHHNHHQAIGTGSKLTLKNNEKLITAKTIKNIAPKLTNPLYENKLFIERQQSSFSMGGNGGRIDNRPCTGEIKLDSSTGTSMDHSFRLYKMSSETKNCYELPKLLIREDSPVESFHSSDPQLETIALRGDSPITAIDTFPKLSSADTTITSSTMNSDNRCVSANSTSTIGSSNGTILKSPWNNHHHHSDLGLNNLELNFLNDELSDCEGGGAGTTTTSTTTCLQKSNNVLKIASNLEINKWKTSSSDFDCVDNNSQPHTATSLNFINGDISSSDEDDAFNGSSCDLLHANSKSKSVELNEFRMMFGSSPTLLNYNPVTQPSRLDAIPFQYRRGYSNLNDACLSSSTSDLECFHRSKKSTKNGGNCIGGGIGSSSGGGSSSTGGGINSSGICSSSIGGGSSGGVSGVGQELSLLRHRNGRLGYVRSYENLDRAKIVRMKNEKRMSNIGGSGIGNSNCGTGGDSTSSSTNSLSKGEWKFHNHFERERIQTKDDSNDDFSYYNLGYDNTVGSIGFPVGYQSNESLFNINFDTLEDDVFEIDTLGLFESADLSSSTSTSSSSNSCKNSLLLEDKCKTNTSFLLPEITSLSQSLITNETSPTTLLSSDKSIISPQKLSQSSSISITTKSNVVTPKKSQKLRCAECNKKLGVIMVMKCHCEKLFCAQHRYAEAHNCSYNFKLEGKEILARENPQVIAQKLPKI